VTGCVDQLVVREWLFGQAPEGLQKDEIHVWHVLTSLKPDQMDKLAASLSSDELGRAERFRFAKDRARYVIGRGVLRALLADYLGATAKDVRFRYSEKGKPELMPAPGRPGIQFNLAHSGDLVVYGFVKERRVGIDVEEVRFDFRTDEIAERFFSDAEREALRKLPESQRHAGFFRCWTRKEAYLKATGDGLSMPLCDFDVSLAADQPARLLATRPAASEAAKWQMQNLDFGPQYAAALIVESR